MMMRAGTSRSPTTTEWQRRWRGLTLSLLLLPALATAGDPAPEPPLEVQAAHQVEQQSGLRPRLLGDAPSAVRSLDPAIFTALSPVSASEPALRLPDDQQDVD